MTPNKPERKTISLPIDIHHRASEIAKKAGIKQYEFIAAAIELAFNDDHFFQEVINQHKKKYRIRDIDAEVRKRLEALTTEDFDLLLKNLKQSKT